MKQTTTILLTATVFMAIFMSSCHKDKPTTTVTYNNNTFTTVTLVFNGTTTSIPLGGSVSFDGTAGSTAYAKASTAGPGGLTISWTFSDNFPGSGSIVENFDVSSDYFYLYVVNSSAYTIGQEYVNYGLSAEIDDQVTIPNDGNTYGVGYYDAYSNTKVHLLTSGGGHEWDYNNMSIPNQEDASYTVTAL